MHLSPIGRPQAAAWRGPDRAKGRACRPMSRDGPFEGSACEMELQRQNERGGEVQEQRFNSVRDDVPKASSSLFTENQIIDPVLLLSNVRLTYFRLRELLSFRAYRCTIEDTNSFEVSCVRC